MRATHAPSAPAPDPTRASAVGRGPRPRPRHCRGAVPGRSVGLHQDASQWLGRLPPPHRRSQRARAALAPLGSRTPCGSPRRRAARRALARESERVRREMQRGSPPPRAHSSGRGLALEAAHRAPVRCRRHLPGSAPSAQRARDHSRRDGRCLRKRAAPRERQPGRGRAPREGDRPSPASAPLHSRSTHRGGSAARAGGSWRASVEKAVDGGPHVGGFGGARIGSDRCAPDRTGSRARCRRFVPVLRSSRWRSCSSSCCRAFTPSGSARPRHRAAPRQQRTGSASSSEAAATRRRIIPRAVPNARASRRPAVTPSPRMVLLRRTRSRSAASPSQ